MCLNRNFDQLKVARLCLVSINRGWYLTRHSFGQRLLLDDSHTFNASRDSLDKSSRCMTDLPAKGHQTNRCLGGTQETPAGLVKVLHIRLNNLALYTGIGNGHEAGSVMTRHISYTFENIYIKVISRLGRTNKNTLRSEVGCLLLLFRCHVRLPSNLYIIRFF